MRKDGRSREKERRTASGVIIKRLRGKKGSGEQHLPKRLKPSKGNGRSENRTGPPLDLGRLRRKMKKKQREDIDLLVSILRGDVLRGEAVARPGAYREGEGKGGNRTEGGGH